MNRHAFRWHAIERIRANLVGLDSKMRARFDRGAFRLEFRELRDHAKECDLSYYQKLFEAKAAYHSEEYQRAHDLAVEATVLVLAGQTPAECACSFGKLGKNADVLACATRKGRCCSKGAEASNDSIRRETLKDLPIAYGLIALSKLHLAIATGLVEHLDDAEQAITSVFEIIVPKARHNRLHDILIELAGYSSKQRMELCCGYAGSDRRNYQDLYVTACRIVQLRMRLTGAAPDSELAKQLSALLPAKSLPIYAEGHPWLRTFAADASQDTDSHAAIHHYKEILKDLFEPGPAPTDLRDYYAEICARANLGGTVAPGKVYAAVRLARLAAPAERQILRRDNAVLDELRFDFDGMFWSAFQAEQRFTRFLRHPMTADDVGPVRDRRSSPRPMTFASCSKAVPPPRGKTWRPVEVGGRGDAIRSDVFCVLRSWSSFTPFLPQQWASDRESRFTSRGGGYLLRWRGHGIAVDPGPSFIRNLYEAGFKIDDVNTVVVTHNHPDHTYEVESMLNLASRAGHQIPNFLLSRNANTGLRNKIKMSSAKSRIVVFGAGDAWRLTYGNSAVLTIRGLLAHHADIGPAREVSAFGVAFHEKQAAGKERVLAAISSDTHWCKQVQESLKSVKYAEIFVAHVSRVEFEQMCEPGRYYSKHLGVLGAFGALRTVRPRVGVLSEWGEELAGYRAAIAGAVQRALRASPRGDHDRPCCLPGDRGLRFEFDETRRARVVCTFPQQRREFDECGRTVEMTEIVVDAHVDDGEHRIHYLCPDHRC